MACRRENDDPATLADEGRNPIDEHKVTEVVRAELSFKTIHSSSKWRCHHACVCDDHIERVTYVEQLLSASAHAFQIRKVQFDYLKSATASRGVSPHLGCSCFS